MSGVRPIKTLPGFPSTFRFPRWNQDLFYQKDSVVTGYYEPDDKIDPITGAFIADSDGQGNIYDSDVKSAIFFAIKDIEPNELPPHLYWGGWQRLSTSDFTIDSLRSIFLSLEAYDSDIEVALNNDSDQFVTDSEMRWIIDSEAHLRRSGDSDLKAHIDSELAVLLSKLVDSEWVTRQVDSEASDRKDADSELGIGLKKEIHDRAAGDSDLSIRLDQETHDRIEADSDILLYYKDLDSDIRVLQWRVDENDSELLKGFRIIGDSDFENGISIQNNDELRIVGNPKNTQTLSAGRTLQVELTDNVEINKDLLVNGNTTLVGDLLVNGTRTILNTTISQTDDTVILLNRGQPSPLNDIGFIFQRYDSETIQNYNVALVWDEQTKTFQIGETATGDSESQIDVHNVYAGFNATRLDMHDRFISNVKDPIADQDAATKFYVDSEIRKLKDSDYEAISLEYTFDSDAVDFLRSDANTDFVILPADVGLNVSIVDFLNNNLPTAIVSGWFWFGSSIGPGTIVMIDNNKLVGAFPWDQGTFAPQPTSITINNDVYVRGTSSGISIKIRLNNGVSRNCLGYSFSYRVYAQYPISKREERLSHLERAQINNDTIEWVVDTLTNMDFGTY